jgi:hypothetical protein
MESENLAARNQRLARTQNKAYFDSTAHLRSEYQSIQVGDLVVVFRPSMLLPIKHHDEKLDDRWQGPYRVKEKPQTRHTTSSKSSQLDGTPMKRKYAGDQVKKYYPRLPPKRPPVDIPSPDTASPVFVVPPEP